MYVGCVVVMRTVGALLCRQFCCRNLRFSVQEHIFCNESDLKKCSFFQQF
jgi:hypothetical protein